MANQVLRHIESGYRMKSPEDCPSTVYALMLRTWQSEPSNRPSFVEILKELLKLHNTTSNMCNSTLIPPILPSKLTHPVSISDSTVNNSVLDMNKTFSDSDSTTPWGTTGNKTTTVTNSYNSMTYKGSDNRENLPLMKKQSINSTSNRRKYNQRPKTLADLVSCTTGL